MELSFIRILISILESKECFVVLTALEAGLCALYYRQPDNDILFFLLVTFGVSLVLMLIIYLRQRIVFKREFERQKKEAILRERLIIEKEKGKASDVFNNMNEDDKTLFLYAILSGTRSNENRCKFFYRSGNYTALLYRIEEICSNNLFNSLARYESNGNNFSILFDPYLLDIAEKNINEYKITKEQLEDYLNRMTYLKSPGGF